jgi:hypothetical protein
VKEQGCLQGKRATSKEGPARNNSHHEPEDNNRHLYRRDNLKSEEDIPCFYKPRKTDTVFTQTRILLYPESVQPTQQIHILFL